MTWLPHFAGATFAAGDLARRPAVEAQQLERRPDPARRPVAAE